jgi:hypothetical protein
MIRLRLHLLRRPAISGPSIGCVGAGVHEAPVGHTSFRLSRIYAQGRNAARGRKTPTRAFGAAKLVRLEVVTDEVKQYEC